MHTTDKSSLDLLEHEDHILIDLFDQLRSHEGQTVDQRYVYGNAAKQVILHVSLRQASLLDVANAIKPISELAPIADRLVHRAIERRRLYDQLGKMSRGIQGVYLNQGQDFNSPLFAFIAQVQPEIHWELTEAIPVIRTTAAKGAFPQSLKSAHYIRRHAPTRLDPSGPSWRETTPVIARLVTFLNHLRAHPRATAGDRIS